MLATLFAVATIGLAVALPGSVAFDILHADSTELRQDPAACNAPDVGPGEDRAVAVRVSWAPGSAAKAQALADIEGTYRVGKGCHAGHRSFISLDGARQKILWFSEAYQDWNFNEGTQARPEEVVAFGSDESGGQGQQSPESVTNWFLVREAGLLTSLEDLYHEAAGLRVESIGPAAGMAVR